MGEVALCFTFFLIPFSFHPPHPQGMLLFLWSDCELAHIVMGMGSIRAVANHWLIFNYNRRNPHLTRWRTVCSNEWCSTNDARHSKHRSLYCPRALYLPFFLDSQNLQAEMMEITGHRDVERFWSTPGPCHILYKGLQSAWLSQRLLSLFAKPVKRVLVWRLWALMSLLGSWNVSRTTSVCLLIKKRTREAGVY